MDIKALFTTPTVNELLKQHFGILFIFGKKHFCNQHCSDTEIDAVDGRIFRVQVREESILFTAPVLR